MNTKSMSKIFEIIIMIVVVLIIFYGTTRSIGSYRESLKIWGISVLFTLLILLAAFLITGHI